MLQPIAGVTPPELAEAPLLIVWPTLGANAIGRWVGQVCSTRLGFGPLTVGNLLALVTIPVSLCVFFWQLMPFVCRRYALTTRRIVIRRGLTAVEDRWINLDEFDEIVINVLPGQKWLRCGDVIFRRGATELLCLAGVGRPEVFRRSCLKAQTALMSVGRVLREAAQNEVENSSA